MAIKRMDNVLIVVEDLQAMKAFLLELGMEVEGETTVEGDWASKVIGLKNVKADIATLRTPDGHNKIELSQFHTPAAVKAGAKAVSPNTLGVNRIMFAVDDVEKVVAHLSKHGAELVGEIMNYQDVYKLCYIRGPEGIMFGLAQEL